MTKPQPDLQLIDRWEVIRMLGISESTLDGCSCATNIFHSPAALAPARCAG